MSDRLHSATEIGRGRALPRLAQACAAFARKDRKERRGW
jgi:hypothetical protein